METPPLTLTPAERAELERRTRSRSGRAQDAVVARVLLLLADGLTYRAIAERTARSEPCISKWKHRFLEAGLAGLYVRHAGRPVQVLTPKLEARHSGGNAEAPVGSIRTWLS